MTGVAGIELVAIPAGTFLMGSPENEPGRDPEDEHLHQVTLSRGFWIGRFEVTQAQWKLVMGNNPSKWNDCPDCPVENVSWEDCRKFLQRLNARQGGQTYDLPTEAEWEYACRAGSQTPFTYGRFIRADFVNFWEKQNHSKQSFRGRTVPVGSLKAPNAWGLHDMHGNLWEWCSDWYAKDYYLKSPAVDPQGPKTRVADYLGKVARGGCYENESSLCRSSIRNHCDPKERDDGFGFRVVVRSSSPNPGHVFRK